MNAPLVRKIISTSLAVSFIAMSTSGMMMFVIEKPSFTIQMHPVHKLFGLIMILSVFGHLYFNFRSLLNHLKTRSVSVVGGVLVALMVMVYGVAMYNTVPPELAEQMDSAAALAE